MKSTKRFISLTVLTILLAAGLTSCGNLLMAGIDEKGETAVSGQASTGGKAAIGSISGSVTAEGALPAQLVRRPASSARTAFPNADFSSENYIYTAKLLQSNTVIKTTVFNGNSYSFGNLDNGTYTISVEVTKDGKVVLSGSSGTITISDETPSATPAPLLLKPASTETGTGNINLRVYSVSTDVKKVDAWLVTNNGTKNKTFTFSGGYADIEFTDVKAYSLTLEFYKEVAYGNETKQVLAYQCKEVVNVFDNMTTDTWIKNGGERYLVKDTESGTATFKLTEDLLKDFEMNTYYVDSSLTEGRNNGSPFDPFHTLEQAVVAVSSSNTSAAKTILIKAGTTVSEPGDVLNVMQAKGALTIGVYGAEGGTTTATVKKTRNSTFATVVQNASFSVSNINFINTDGISLTTCATWVEIQSGATGTFENCTFSGSTGNNSIYTAAENTTVKNCTFQGDANSVYCSAGSLLHLTGDAHHFTDGSEIVLDSTDTTRAGIYIDSDFNANSHETIPVRLITPSRHVNNNVFFPNIIDNLVAFTVTGPDFDNYEIDSNGKLQLKALSVVARYTANGETKSENCGSFEEAIEKVNGNTGTIYVPSGSTFTMNNPLSISGTHLTIEPYVTSTGDYSSNPTATATIKVNDDCTSNVPFDLKENATLTAKNIIFTSSSYKATYAGYFELLKDTSKATFTNCTFENGKCIYKEGYYSAGAIYCQQGELILDGCTFTNNKNNWNTTAQSGDANDIYLNDGIITLKNQNTFSGPIIIQMDYYHYVGDYSKALSSYIVLDESISLPDGKTTYADFVFASVSNAGMDNPLVIAGLKESTQSWFPCTMPSGEDYFIDSDGKLQKYSKATTLYVGSNGSDSESGYGYSAAKPFATLQHALGQCNSTTSKTIWVEANSTTPETINEQIDISNKIVDIKVSGDGTKVYNFVKSGGSDVQFQINSNSVVSFTGFHFNRSDSVGSGGFAGINNATVTFTDCQFSGAEATGEGGAICAGGSTNLTLTGCTFLNNSASGKPNDIYYSGTSLTINSGNTFSGGIKLVSGSKITIGEELSSSNAKIPVAVGSIPTGTTILDGDGMASALSNDLIVLDTNLFGIDGNGKLQQLVIPETVYIDSNSANGKDAYGYGTADKPFKTLEFVLNHSTPSTVKIKSGHSETSGTISVEADLTIEVYDNFGDTEQTSEGTATIDFKENAYFTVADEDLILNINHITFQRSTPIEGVSGGLILAYSSNYTFTKCTFKSTVINENNGGLVCIDSPSTIVTFDTCKFIGGKTTENGGAIYNAGTLTVDSCTFEGCTHNGGRANYIYSTGETSSTTLKGTIAAFNVSTNADPAYIKLNDKASVLFYDDDDDELYGMGQGDYILIDLQNASEYYSIPFYKAMLNPEENEFYISISPEVADNFGCQEREVDGYYCGYIID